MTPTIVQFARQKYNDEYINCMNRLSEAVTQYAEATLPEALINPPADISPYLYRGVTIGLRYQSEHAARQVIELVDQHGVFPPVRQIPLTRLVVSQAFPASLALDLTRPEGVAVEALLVAVSELLSRVDSEINQATVKQVEQTA